MPGRIPRRIYEGNSNGIPGWFSEGILSLKTPFYNFVFEPFFRNKHHGFSGLKINKKIKNAEKYLEKLNVDNNSW